MKTIIIENFVSKNLDFLRTYGYSEEDIQIILAGNYTTSMVESLFTDLIWPNCTYNDNFESTEQNPNLLEWNTFADFDSRIIELFRLICTGKLNILD